MENLSPVADAGMTFEKVDVQILKLEKAGEYFVGKLVAITDRDYTDRATGETSIIKQMNLADVKGKNPYAVFADAGLMNQLVTANIQPGDVIKCVKGEKKALTGGRTVNTWEVFKAATAH